MTNSNDINPFYNDFAGKNADDGVAKDNFGNVFGNEYDLAKDGAFKGKSIAVLHLYTSEGFDFHLPQIALQEKGFTVIRWTNSLPKIDEFIEVLSKSSQLWLISTSQKLLTNDYLTIIEDFFNKGHGVFLWGDNEPFYQDANVVLERLFNAKMSGNILGDQTVTLQNSKSKIGFIENHPITTGLQFLYEGITIATIEENENIVPLMYGSGGNLVTAIYDRQQKRAIIDGGFTRLYHKWDTAGTARFVKNAAAWLANIEKFDFAENKISITDQSSKKNIKPTLDDFSFNKEDTSNKKIIDTNKPDINKFDF